MADTDDAFDHEFPRETALLRSLGEEPVDLVDAPPEVWDRIAAAAHVDDTGTDARALAPSRTRRRAWVLAVAACVLVLVVGVVALVASRTASGPTELATAELTAYDGAPVGAAGGQVVVVRDDDQLQLRVDMHDLPALAPGTFYEMWLLDPTGGTPVSVGTMREPSSNVATDIDLPPDTDTDTYDVVDVSVQVDGAGPAHSGNSVLRGALST